MKTTPEQLAFFEERIRHWWAVLGMDQAGYRLEVRMEPLKGNRAEVRSSYKSRIADIVLSSAMPKGNASPDQLDDTALHEVCHAFLLPLGNLAWQRFVDEPELAHAEHEVVHRMQDLILRLTRLDP